MKTSPFYIVINTSGRRPRVTRTTASWPRLGAGEIVVRLSLEVPDDLLPKVQEVVLSSVEDVAIGVTTEPLMLDS